MAHKSLNYIDRGDCSEYDFCKEDFITDLNWHDLDLSNIIPKGTQLIHIRIRMASSSLAGINFRKKGNIYGKNTAIIKSQVRNVYYYEEFFVTCDTERKIEYLASNVSWTALDIIIRGWFV